MVIKIRIYFLLLLSLFTQTVNAQQNVFARVSISPRRGMVQQPYKVTISVYTATWYTKPLQFENLQINNAFIIPFTRTLSSVTYMNNKPYATLSFYYLIFPYKEGQLEIPSLKITATTPPLNSSKAEPIVIHSKKQTINVEPLPKTQHDQTLMVAKNIRLQEKWNKKMDSIKVGDVLKRTITINAYGTLPSFIPPLPNQDIVNVSTYNSDPILTDKRNDKDVNGQRVESFSYLFEKEGSTEIPELSVSWVNPNNKQIFTRRLPAKKIMVYPNPDLSMLTSIKDSLIQTNTSDILDNSYPQLSTKRILKFILVIILVFLFFILIMYLIKKYNSYRSAEKQSARYYYQMLLRAIEKGDKNYSLRLLYQWFYKIHNSDNSIENILPKDKRTAYYDIFNYEDKTLNKSEKRKFHDLLLQIHQAIDNTDINDSNTINPN